MYQHVDRIKTNVKNDENENIQLMIIQSFRYKLMKLKVMKVITLILHAKQRFFLSKLNMSFLLELYKLRDDYMQYNYPYIVTITGLIDRGNK